MDNIGSLPRLAGPWIKNRVCHRLYRRRIVHEHGASSTAATLIPRAHFLGTVEQPASFQYLIPFSLHAFRFFQRRTDVSRLLTILGILSIVPIAC